MICSLGLRKIKAAHQPIFVVQQTVDYFPQRRRLGAGYFCLLLMSVTLFQKLIERNTSQCFIGIIQNWYHKLTTIVRYKGMLSYNFNVSCGVRQGDVLSPLLFNVYGDNLLRQLDLRCLGC